VLHHHRRDLTETNHPCCCAAIGITNAWGLKKLTVALTGVATKQIERRIKIKNERAEKGRTDVPIQVHEHMHSSRSARHPDIVAILWHAVQITAYQPARAVGGVLSELLKGIYRQIYHPCR
jgi:hypothetical protein